MKKKLVIAVIGCGAFSQKFINLFKAHPNVEKVYVCDLISEKAQEFSQRFGVEIISSFEEALSNTNINCIANFTQRHLHGDITIRALKAGKHVYSAVPMASTVEECQEIVRLVKETKLTYVIGETCYYYPCAMFCREAYAQGKFGDFAYGRPSSYISGLYGTKGSYEFSNAQHLLSEKDLESEQESIKLTDVSDYVNPKDMVENKHAPDFKEQVANGKWQWSSFAQVQAKECARLPKTYEGLENGHMASHQFLIDDFCTAAFTGKLPALNAWFAARCNIPGLIAIKSAKQGGIPLDVPDCGDAPKEW
ncbi:MAG: Gfo/Idh/MocA family oxidoreductase [Clostridia bacterium]|nr:Gfo/Idh/MocA family oxidoreductase [Clostridia bacterium]